MKDKISILAISDIHIGCPRSNPHLLHDKLKKFLYPQITKDIDILFICGDFFDTQLTLNAYAAFESLEIIREIKALCKDVGCDLRVLRGTFTHDRTQPQHFIMGEPPDSSAVKLMDTVCLEHHEKTGLDILYIPDNHGYDNIYDEIDKLLKSHNLEQVDILVHHGYFKHMLPEALLVKGLPHGCLDYEHTSKFVRGCVLNGHVHIPSVYKNIVSVGSFDRLAHGEEMAKGFYRIDITQGQQHQVYSIKFIENKDATKFITYNLLTFDTSDKAMDWFNHEFNELLKTVGADDPLRIRIVSDDKAVVEGCAQLAKSLHSNVVIDRGSTVKRSQYIENTAIDLSELPVITDDNLVELLMPLLRKKNPCISEQTVKSILATVGCATKEENHDQQSAENSSK